MKFCLWHCQTPYTCHINQVCTMTRVYEGSLFAYATTKASKTSREDRSIMLQLEFIQTCFSRKISKGFLGFLWTDIIIILKYTEKHYVRLDTNLSVIFKDTLLVLCKFTHPQFQYINTVKRCMVFQFPPNKYIFMWREKNRCNLAFFVFFLIVRALPHPVVGQGSCYPLERRHQQAVSFCHPSVPPHQLQLTHWFHYKYGQTLGMSERISAPTSSILK